MGKYELEYDGNSILTDYQEILCWISNELAEANRLKRFELSHTDGYNNEKELEDQA